MFFLFFSSQVHNLVAIELAYINTKHPDFTDAAQVSASVNSQQVHTCIILQPFCHQRLSYSGSEQSKL